MYPPTSVNCIVRIRLRGSISEPRRRCRRETEQRARTAVTDVPSSSSSSSPLSVSPRAARPIVVPLASLMLALLTAWMVEGVVDDGTQTVLVLVAKSSTASLFRPRLPRRLIVP